MFTRHKLFVLQSSWFWVYTCGDVDDGSFLTRPLWCNTEYNLFQPLIEISFYKSESRWSLVGNQSYCAARYEEYWRQGHPKHKVRQVNTKPKVEGPRSLSICYREHIPTAVGDTVERNTITVSETFGQAFLALANDMYPFLFHPMLMLGKHREALHFSVHGN